MKPVICGGILYSSVYECAEAFAVSPSEVFSAIRTSGRLSVFGYPVRYADARPEAVPPRTPSVRGLPLLKPGHVRHRLGAWVG